MPTSTSPALPMGAPAALAPAGAGAHLAAQPAPPAPPAPATAAEQAQVREAVQQVAVETQRAAQEAARDAREAAREAQEAAREAASEAVEVSVQPGGMSVVRDASGHVVVTTADGRKIVIDPRAVADPDAQQAIIHEALTNTPSPMPSDHLIEQVIPLAGIMFAFITTMVLGLPLIRYWIRRQEGRAATAAPTALPAEMGQRLDRIDQAVEAMAIEMERVAEAQRFSARLLSERLPDALPAADRDRAVAPRTSRAG